MRLVSREPLPSVPSGQADSQKGGRPQGTPLQGEEQRIWSKGARSGTANWQFAEGSREQ